MTIPTKDEVPEWVRYVAQDANGGWYGYDQMPSSKLANLRWAIIEIEDEIIFIKQDTPPADWTKECYEIARL